MPNQMDIKSALTVLHNRQTFPSVFIDGISIGGNDDIQKLEKIEMLAQIFSARRLVDQIIPDPPYNTIIEFSKSHNIVVVTSNIDGAASASEQVNAILGYYVKTFGLSFYGN